MSKEKFKVKLKVLDERTKMVLNSLANMGYLKDILHPISEGKEAVVFLGESFEEDYLAVKIYRVTMKTFQSIRKYLEGDPRAYLGKRRSVIIYNWVRREFRNLLRAERVGVRVPKPITYKKNVLLMEFIGEDGIPAPIVKENPPKDPEKWFSTIISWIKDLALKERLVHGDVSEYNILNYNEEPVVIDWGQGTLIDSPIFFELLQRDIQNTFRYFSSLGVDTGDPLDFYKEIVERLL